MKRGPYQILIALDQLANACAWGSARQTISGRSWVAKAAGKAWGRIAVSLIDGLFGPGHCERSAASDATAP